MKVGLLSLMFVVFLVLKLTGVVAWSWFWVASPLILAALLWVAGLVLIAFAGSRLK